jgi:hypothetical protein
MVVIPDYGGITTDYLLLLGLGAFGAARYELAYNGLDLWTQRTYANQPQDSVPDFLFLYRGLAAGHLKAYNKALADIQVLYTRSLRAERTDSLLPFPLKTNDYRSLHGACPHGADLSRAQNVGPEHRGSTARHRDESE